jgi:hypothetical protein
VPTVGFSLHVVDPTLAGGDTSHINVYCVGADGSLTHIQSTPHNLPRGVSGAAAF